MNKINSTFLFVSVWFGKLDIVDYWIVIHFLLFKAKQAHLLQVNDLDFLCF